MHPLSIILVKSDSKGDRLLFRYPFVQMKEGSETSKYDKKKNPYSITLLQEERQISLDPAAMNVQLESDEVLSSLFACKLELANQKFELKINDIRFVSHPALMENKSSNSFILINIVFALPAQCSYSIGERECVTCAQQEVINLHFNYSKVLLRVKQAARTRTAV
jgi:hypothetical protein